jgi:hypothetical protein
MAKNRSSLSSSQLGPNRSPGGWWAWAGAIALMGIGIAYVAWNAAEWQSGGRTLEAGWLNQSDEATAASSSQGRDPKEKPLRLAMEEYKPRMVADTSGYGWVVGAVKPWPAHFSLADIGGHFRSSILASIEGLDALLADPKLPVDQRASTRFSRSTFLNFEGKPEAAYEDLRLAREWVETQPQVAKDFLYTLIYAQGVTAMRRGENENCILCRGETSCILPISKAAVHIHPEGSRLAIQHFAEYLDRFPNDGEVRWLLNVAHMTLDQHPQGVQPDRLVDIGAYTHQESGIGRFRDMGDRVGLNRLNQAGGAIMEDFDHDGLLDIIVSSFDPTQMMGVYINDGQGKFIDQTDDAGVANQLGGLNCVQTDFNNDGWMDVLIVRGAWLPSSLAMRPTLLRNNGDRTFSDVTEEAGMGEPLNSISATWSDYDNDGWLDLFVCCEQQSNRLYRNLKNGTFEEVAAKAGVAGGVGFVCKGANWLDYDNDGWPDLFLNHLSNVGAKLYRNRRDGTFENVTQRMGIQGPIMGFSCWAWDFNNDGWQDIFATNYSRSIDACVKGMLGQPHTEPKSCLYMNLQGHGFKDVASEVGLDDVYIAMGSNFADFDNDGWLDLYLGTGDPSLGTLVPNRLFRSVRGERFVDISASSGTGNLQKGHGVACGDWDRDGCIDLFIEMGGAVNGDKYHNILFQNPGNDRAWIRLKLIGKQTNRAAIGARIKIETDGTGPTTLHRHITSGSSFGANPLEQTIGLGDATRIKSLEITWPTSQTVQTFRDLAVRQAIEITESEEMYHPLESSPVTLAVDP